MASQVAHIVYAKKYLDSLDSGTLPNGSAELLPEQFDRDLFILGSVFPDIRRVDGHLKRRETHMILEALNLDFSYLDSFHAGWKLHLYCDMRREEILNRYDFYDLDGSADHWNLAAKMLEDELVYPVFNNWGKICAYFQNPPIVDTGIGVSRETFELWYAIIAKYLEKKPDSRSINVFLSKQGKLAEISKDIVASVDKLRKNDKVVELLRRVAEEIV